MFYRVMDTRYFENKFPRHMNNVRKRLGNERARAYAEAIYIRFCGSVYCIVSSIYSLYVLLCDFYSDEEGDGFFITSFAIVVAIYQLLTISRIASETDNDYELSRLWTKITLISSVCGFFFGTAATLIQIDGSKELSSEEYVVDCGDLGITITIPEEWTHPEWMYKSGETGALPRYYFKVNSKGNAMWYDVYGKCLLDSDSVNGLIDQFNDRMKKTLDGSVIEHPKIVKINGKMFLRAIGVCSDTEDYIYVCYETVHNHSKLCYTYSFNDKLDFDEEVTKADDIVSMIKFSFVERPINTSRKDARPDDYTISEGAIDISSACLTILLPEVDSEVIWKERTRNRYVFDIVRDGYNVEFDLKVVYTSETASLTEFSEDFVNLMTKFLDADVKFHPSIVKLSNTDAMRAEGYRKDSPGTLYIRYQIIHKGALLCVEANVPGSLNTDIESKAVKKLIENIQLY